MDSFDPRTFRDALGQFATGVTIVTARSEDGTPVGVTANSFNSVSLDPPLVLWSLAKTSRCMPVFETAEEFAVHILASDQDDLSNRFASRTEDKFAGLNVGETGLPLLEGCTARFRCKTRHAYEGGDHIIFVGEVVGFEHDDKPPLLFHGGDYADKKKRVPISAENHGTEMGSDIADSEIAGPPVLYGVDGSIATIMLNRPGARNALSEEVIAALVDALDEAEADSKVSCVVLTGAGDSFCSGGNIKQIKALTAEKRMSPLELEQWYRDHIQRIPRAMDAMSVPVIAAINGHAIGAGCDLACMCDIRIAADNAVFAESFLRVGIIPGDGGAWLLPRTIGMARASQMLLTGEFINAAKALDYGLVTEVLAPDALLDRAQALAEMVVQYPPAAIRKSKRLLKDARDMSLGEHLDEAAIWQGVLQQMDDHREAIDAILEKRAPRFTGR
ncbi:enoyl-CoA hydratase-related protein [Alterisphingorhabdus coralli]|uniref:Enoyl-CoA hydratase-related protein n=1 Tax=Alterisphingorhabdus coralli TaxID=3071408 RepID=A0AA97HZF3_9SPHN|nr:enoyl-CoA hydratase-related protein [Parasphingorhabdus sp. SCSIO 66989]WOE74584.1 enoyl-CoA hydratase-related protein [Parasphingorhabdus sp. SCSIO 66989]